MPTPSTSWGTEDPSGVVSLSPPASTMRAPEPARAGDDALISDGPVDLRTVVADLEHRYISEALDRSEGVVAEAARLLSLQRTTLIEKMRKYGLHKAAA